MAGAIREKTNRMSSRRAMKTNNERTQEITFTKIKKEDETEKKGNYKIIFVLFYFP